MEKKTESIKTIALSRYKKSVGDSLLLSLTFFLMFGSCFALAILGVDLSLIAILLLGLPALLSMQLMVLRPKKEAGLSNRESFMGFRLYYTFYFGVYRFWLSLLKALLILVLAALVVGLALFHILNACSPSFQEAVSSFITLAQQSETTVQKLYETIYASTPLMNYCSWVSVAAFFFGGYWFFHEIGRNSFNTYVRSFLGAVPSRAANAIFSDFFRGERKDFYKEYYKANWLSIILFVLGYAAGACFGMLVMGAASYGIAFGFIFACLLLSPYLPYFFYAMDEIAKRKEKALVTYALREAEAALAEAPVDDELTKDKREELQKYIDELKKKVEEKENKESENPSGDSSENENSPENKD